MNEWTNSLVLSAVFQLHLEHHISSNLFVSLPTLFFYQVVKVHLIFLFKGEKKDYSQVWTRFKPTI